MTAALDTAMVKGLKAVNRFFAYFAVAIGLGLLALLAGFLSPAELKTAILFGAGSALVAELCAFPALHIGMTYGTPGLLGGFSLGMLVRMATLGLGLLSSGLRGSPALVFAFAYLLSYAGMQAVEIAYVFAVTRAQSPMKPSEPAATERSRA